jgi:hypothetical protein
MREALRPFAEFNLPTSAKLVNDDHPLYETYTPDGHTVITYGDFRKARAIYKGEA